jgi:hypothetical protein
MKTRFSMAVEHLAHAAHARSLLIQIMGGIHRNQRVYH